MIYTSTTVKSYISNYYHDLVDSITINVLSVKQNLDTVDLFLL